MSLYENNLHATFKNPTTRLYLFRMGPMGREALRSRNLNSKPSLQEKLLHSRDLG